MDRAIYSRVPDWRISLTPHGRRQASECGRRLQRLVPSPEKLFIYYSPYRRTRETLDEIRPFLHPRQILGEREDERLREQEMGNYQPSPDTGRMDALWNERSQHGRSYFRFPSGESGVDVYERVSGFIDSVLKEGHRHRFTEQSSRSSRKPPRSVSSLERREMQERQGSSEEAACPPPVFAPSSPSCAAASCSPHDDVMKRQNQGDRVTRSFFTMPIPSSTIEKPSYTSSITSFSPRLQSHFNASSTWIASSSCDPIKTGDMPTNDIITAMEEQDYTVLIVAHGLLIRLFIGYWFNVNVEKVEVLENPPNCSMTVLQRDPRVRNMLLTPISKKLFGKSFEDIY